MSRDAFLPLGLPVLVCPFVRVDDATAVSGMAVIGPPAPTALVGLGHALERCLGVPVKGSAVMVHEFSLHAGFAKLPVETRKAVQDGDGAGPIIEDPRSRLTCSLFFAVDAHLADLAGIASQAARALPRLRFGGGTIVEAGLPPDDHAGRGPAAVTCADADAFRKLVFSLPPGSLLRQRSDLLPSPGEGDALDALLDAIGRRSSDGKEWHRTQRGWIVPIQLGYRAISPLAWRPGMREGAGVVGHVWAEEVLGLGEWVYRARAWGTRMKGMFWKHQADPGRGLYVAEAQ